MEVSKKEFGAFALFKMDPVIRTQEKNTLDTF